MKKYFLLAIMISTIGLYGQQTTNNTQQTNTSTDQVIEAEVNPMRPDFGGNLRKKKIKIKEKNKVIFQNILKSNKLLYKKAGR
jgi:hypothetical protein